MEKLDFQQPLLQSSVSHDSSQIILNHTDLVLKEIFFFIIFFTDLKLLKGGLIKECKGECFQQTMNIFGTEVLALLTAL